MMYDTDIETVAADKLREDMVVYDHMRIRWCDVTELYISDEYILGVKPVVFTGVYPDGQKRVHRTTSEVDWTAKKGIPKP